MSGTTTTPSPAKDTFPPRSASGKYSRKKEPLIKDKKEYMRNYMVNYRKQEKENKRIGAIVDGNIHWFKTEDIGRITQRIANMYAKIFDAYPLEEQYKKKETIDNMLAAIEQLVIGEINKD
jgi:hypothetical protein